MKCSFIAIHKRIHKLNNAELQCVQITEKLRTRDQHQRGSRAFIRNNDEVQQGLFTVENAVQRLTEILNQQSITAVMYVFIYDLS